MKYLFLLGGAFAALVAYECIAQFSIYRKRESYADNTDAARLARILKDLGTQGEDL